MSVSSVPGFDILGLTGAGEPAAKSASASSTPSTQNPYQQTYDQIETWSSSYLLQALEYGAPAIPQFTGGQSVDSFAQLTSTLAAIKPLIDTTA